MTIISPFNGVGRILGGRGVAPTTVCFRKLGYSVWATSHSEDRKHWSGGNTTHIRCTFDLPSGDSGRSYLYPLAGNYSRVKGPRVSPFLSVFPLSYRRPLKSVALIPVSVVPTGFPLLPTDR